MTTTSLADVQTIALEKMKEHGLLDSGWYFSYDRAKKRLGCCNYSTKRITLSSILTPSRPLDETINTILHEIAHALVGHKHGHNEVWRAKAIEIGCNGDRCSANSGERPEFRWYAICDTCDARSGMHRAPGRVRSCTSCAPWGFSYENIVRWEQWGQEVQLSQMPVKYINEYLSLERVYAPKFGSTQNHTASDNREDANV